MEVPIRREGEYRQVPALSKDMSTSDRLEYVPHISQDHAEGQMEEYVGANVSSNDYGLFRSSMTQWTFSSSHIVAKKRPIFRRSANLAYCLPHHCIQVRTVCESSLGSRS